MQYARDNEWLYLTFDDVLVSLVQRERLDHASIIYVTQAGKRIGDVVKGIDAYLDGREDTGRRIHFPKKALPILLDWQKTLPFDHTND